MDLQSWQEVIIPEETNNCIACGLNHILTNMHFYEYNFNDLFLISHYFSICFFSLFNLSLFYCFSLWLNPKTLFCECHLGSIFINIGDALVRWTFLSSYSKKIIFFLLSFSTGNALHLWISHSKFIEGTLPPTIIYYINNNILCKPGYNLKDHKYWDIFKIEVPSNIKSLFRSWSLSASH